MKIGVIITVYNLERYIAEAVESVLAQSRPADKIIIVDDGSVDRSRKVIEPFKGRVELIKNPQNQGVLPSIISAMKEMDTDIFTFLDGDDRWHKDKIKSIAQAFEADDDVMLVTHSYRRINSAGQVSTVLDKTLRNLERIENLAGTREENDHELKTSILSYKGVWLGSAFAIRSKYLNVREFENWSINISGHSLSHQDQPLAAYLILTHPHGKITYLPKKLFDYRIHDDNSSGSSFTPDRALRTLARSRATLLRTSDAVSKMLNRPHELKTQQDKLREIQYLESLYTHNISKAIPLFFTLFFSFWDVRERAKESIRLLGIIALGANRFLKHKKYYSPTRLFESIKSTPSEKN